MDTISKSLASALPFALSSSAISEGRIFSNKFSDRQVLRISIYFPIIILAHSTVFINDYSNWVDAAAL
ncbi:hypothetical protein [Patiriisocius sp. Uisw_017]|uniref:hypothetical protein n=1 Tax=Patiriisocius sp. Uisw_017 TaxID=3230968 RepID=UPI0039E83B63